MQDYLNGLDEDLWNCISGNRNPPSNVQPLGSSSGNSEVENQADRLKKLEKRCMRELRGTLPLVFYNYVRSYKTANEIWNNLKEKFQGSEKPKVNSVKQCLVELKDIRQKDGESIEVYYDHLNELIYRCNRYGITRSAMEFNMIFVMGLRKEWRSVSMMVKNQQSFDTSTLNDLYNQLKTHEGEVNETTEESKAMLGGPLALMSKIYEKDAEKDASDEDEGFIMNFDDEAITFYSNNRVKKFFKKPFNLKAKSSKIKGNFLIKNVGEEKKREEKKKEEKQDSKAIEGKSEKKLKGDTGIDCHYCNGANHIASDCMLRKKDERKMKVKDEAYYAEKLEEVRTKAKNLSLVAEGTDEEEDVSFDETVTYFDSIVVSASNEAKKLSMQLLETQKKLDLKISRIDCLELQITNIMVDRDNLSRDNKLLLAQRNIYCNAAKRLYGKLTQLHHSCEISKEQHRKLLPFLAFERTKVDNISYDCEKEIADFDKVPNDKYRYGIVKVDEYDSDNTISEISELEDVDCSQLTVVNVASNSKGKEKVKDLIVEYETDIPSTSKVGEMNFVDLKDCQTDDSDDEEVEKVSKEKVSSKEEEIPRIVVDQVYGDTQNFEEVMKEKGSHYLETNTVVFPNFKCTDDVIFPNQVFVTKGNVKNIKPELKKMVEEDNSKTTEEVNTSYVDSYVAKPKVDFVPQKPNFPNYTKKETMRTSREKGIASRKNIDHWLEGKGKIYQSNKYSKEQINEAYEKYVNTSSNGSSSSKDSNISVKAWRAVSKAKTVQSQTQDAKGEVNEHSKLSNSNVSVPLDDEVNLIDNLKTKVCD
ncbi:hypothetical protein Lser_V15G03678 [Lactuca serriola]